MIKNIAKKAHPRRVIEATKMRVFSVLNNKGMELVQVAILVAIAIVIGLLFKDKIEAFVVDIFGRLSSNEFSQ